MNFKKNINWTTLLLAASLIAAPALFAQPGQQQGEPTSQDSSQQPAPDNTKTNQRDKDKNSPTADQQKMNPADRAITKKIRMAIHADKSLSTYAHNVKIIAQDGKVTLKGPVRSEEEKANIATKAIAVAGDGNVDNQLDVVPPKQ